MTYAIIPLEVAFDRRLNASDLRALIALQSFANRNGECFPRLATLAARIKISVTRTSELIQRLVKLGWLIVTRTGRASRYKIVTPEHLLSTPPKESLPVETDSLSTRCTLKSDFNPVLEDALRNIEQTISTETPLNPPADGLADQHAHVATKGGEQLALDFNAPRPAPAPRPEPTPKPVEPPPVPAEAPKTAQNDTKAAAVVRPQRVEAKTPENSVKAVLGAFKKFCGLEFSENGAVATKIGKAIQRNGLKPVLQTIEAKGAAFKFPLALLKDAVIESTQAERNRTPTPTPTEPDRPAPAPKGSGGMIHGVARSEIERRAQAGESWEQAAMRIAREDARRSKS